jgi:hypothetical protein
MLASLFSYLTLLDNWMAGALAELPRVCAWGFGAGILGIALYAAASNQAEIGRLKAEARACRRRLLDPRLADEDFSRLTKLNLKVSLRLLAKVIGPALLSALPIIVVALWMNMHHPQPGTTWMLMESFPVQVSGWEVPFFVSVFAAALGMKMAFRLH